MSEHENVIPMPIAENYQQGSDYPSNQGGSDNPPAGKNAVSAGRGKGGRKAYKPTLDDSMYIEMFKRFTLIYPTDQVFDHHERVLARIGHLRHAFGRNVKRWLESPKREMINLKDIIFDASAPPGGLVAGTINLFHGFPLKPKKGDCEILMDLFIYICKDKEVLDFVLKWIAYPLQHPGTKMQTAIIMHGDEGTGKSFLWREVVARIYGEYAGVIGQAELESQFNPWASKKLMLIAEEVVSRAELNSHKGKLKHLVTGGDILINDKNVPLRPEKNQANFVFLSNEIQPNKLDHTDRRYCVIYTPPPLGKEFYEEAAQCIRNGGVEAFYHYLMNLDLTGFGPHTKPPLNDDKRELVEISMSAEELFFNEWREGSLSVPFMTCTTEQVYQCFSRWCTKAGYKFPPNRHRLSRQFDLLGRPFGLEKRQMPRNVGYDVKRTVFFIIGQPPEGVSWQVWLAAQEKHFQESMDA
jgi:putative DNA primase/helicase